MVLPYLKGVGADQCNILSRCVQFGWQIISLSVFYLGLAKCPWLAVPFLQVRKPRVGNLTDARALSPKFVDLAMKATLLYLLIGSYSLLFILKKNRSDEISIET